MLLNFENKKNAIFLIVFIACCVGLVQFIYIPKAQEVKKLKRDYKDMKRELSELYSFIGGEENLKDNIVQMEKDIDALQDAFPDEKEASNVIKYINDEAQRFKVNVKSLMPNDLYQYKDKAGNPILISGYTSRCMPLTLSVEARYRALGEFLGSLEMNKSPLITIESVSISKDENIKPLVNVKVELVAYVLGN